MKQSYATLALAAALSISSATHLMAQAPIRLGVYTALEVEYETELGKSYTLQGSTNLTQWYDVGELLPGTGRRVNRIFSTKNGGEVNYNSYRLRQADGPTNGFAPWSLGGISVELDDEPGGDLTHFLTATNGEDVSEGDTDVFSYLYSRLGDNQGKAEITYASNRTEVLTFEFTGLGVGTWSRDEFRNGKLKDHDAGPFRIAGVAPAPAGTSNTVVNPNVVVAPPLAPPAPPASLSNLVYYFQASGIPDRYEFIDGSNGREVQGVVQEGLPTNSLVYTYTVLSSNTAFLRLSFGYYGMGGDRYDCDLTFTDGSSGHFTRKLYRRGVLKDTDEGAFSQDSNFGSTGSGDNSSTPPPASTNVADVWPPVVTPTAPPAPPASMVGKTYYVYTSPSPDEYRFVAGNYGYAMPNAVRADEVETTPGGNVYMYTYSNTGSNTASLVITYGYYNLGGDREEYDLTYVDGSTATFNRRLYRLGTLYTNQAGIFSTNTTLPYAFNPGSGTGGNNGAVNTNPPPSSAMGFTFNTSTGEHIKCNTATSGVQTDNSNPTDFTYTYTLVDANTATLHVQLKADKWDDYTLYFSNGGNGSFTRDQYTKSELKDSDSGTFTVTVNP